MLEVQGHCSSSASGLEAAPAPKLEWVNALRGTVDGLAAALCKQAEVDIKIQAVPASCLQSTLSVRVNLGRPGTVPPPAAWNSRIAVQNAKLWEGDGSLTLPAASYHAEMLQ